MNKSDIVLEPLPLLNASEAAQILRITERRVYRLAHSGKLPGFKLGGQWAFDREFIRNWAFERMAKNCSGMQ